MEVTMRSRAVALVAALCALSLLAFAPAASATTTYSFQLTGPNTAVNPGNGDMIRVTGSGTFDTSAHTVVASGSFTHRTSTGMLVARGVWAATAFVGFDSFGGPNNGIQGGVLDITATLFPDGGTPHTGVPIEVVCVVNAPAGFTEEEGTSVGAFTDHTGGTTLFHLGD
jgi:hypothetical protein